MDDDVFEFEVDGDFLSGEPQGSGSDEEPTAQTHTTDDDSTKDSSTGEYHIPCKAPRGTEDAAERAEQVRLSKLMSSSVPIKIPMSASLASTRRQASPDEAPPFVPPHEAIMAERDALLEGSLPEAGFRTSLLRQRNKVFRQTGFLEPSVTDFVVSRVSTGITLESLNASSSGGTQSSGGGAAYARALPAGIAASDSRRSALALALTPVPEQVAMMGGR